MERYLRQQAIQGWNQDKLSGATLAIAGSGAVAFWVGLMAAAMGFGRLVLIGEEGKGSVRDRGFSALLRSSVVRWADFFRRVNPAIEICPVPKSDSGKLNLRLPKVDCFIAAGNDLGTMRLATQINQRTSIPAFAGGAVSSVGFWGVPRINAAVRRLSHYPESSLTGQIVAGLLVDGARRALLPLTDEMCGKGGLHFFALPRLPGYCEADKPRFLHLPCDSLAVVGAGALGTWFGLAMGSIDFRGEINLFDADVVDETNLNRQVLFFGAVGRPKAPVLAARLHQLFPTLQVNGYGARVDESTALQVGRSSLLAACPDNFEVRAFMNGLARAKKRILLNGGTSAWGGSCAIYAPGHTACLGCLMDIDRLAQQETQAQGCAQVAQASVVTSNAITGALLAWCVQELVAGRVKRGIWEYDGRGGNNQLGVHSTRPACKCHLS